MKRGLHVFLSILVLLLIFSPAARADTGPKPSVCITFADLPDGPCYGTLLSQRNTNGPDWAYGTYGEEEPGGYRQSQPGWETFVNYQDPDGYYYLQLSWEVHETLQLNWTYYPPDPFKILLYFPESGTFISSDILERYAFDSYFSATVNGDTLTVRRSYNYTWELISLAARVLLTIAIELAIALLFKYRAKRQFVFLAAVNIITQIALNVALNIINYSAGWMAFVAFYILLELAVFAIEAVLYSAFLPKLGRATGKGRAVAYAFAANAVSFAAGFMIAKLIPGIF